MLKKGIFVVILAVFLGMVYADGNAKDIPLSDIEKRLDSKTKISEMAKCSNRDLLQFISLDYQIYDSHIYYKSDKALSVEELLIVKAKNKDDLAEVKDAVEKRVESQITTFEGYGAEQVAMLKNYIITTRGNYLFYCVAETPEKYEEVFKDAV